MGHLIFFHIKILVLGIVNKIYPVELRYFKELAPSQLPALSTNWRNQFQDCSVLPSSVACWSFLFSVSGSTLVSSGDGKIQLIMTGYLCSRSPRPRQLRPLKNLSRASLRVIRTSATSNSLTAFSLFISVIGISVRPCLTIRSSILCFADASLSFTSFCKILGSKEKNIYYI